MGNPVRIENIDAMRRREGIDDVELSEDIRGLAVGDFVRLTLLIGDPPVASETVVVRITAIDGPVFRGALDRRPVAKGLSELRAGSPLAFTATHIHSIPQGRPTHEH